MSNRAESTQQCLVERPRLQRLGDVISIPGVILDDVFAVPHAHEIGVDPVKRQGMLGKIVVAPVINTSVEEDPEALETVSADDLECRLGIHRVSDREEKVSKAIAPMLVVGIPKASGLGEGSPPILVCSVGECGPTGVHLPDPIRQSLSDHKEIRLGVEDLRVPVAFSDDQGKREASPPSRKTMTARSEPRTDLTEVGRETEQDRTRWKNRRKVIRDFDDRDTLQLDVLGVRAVIDQEKPVDAKGGKITGVVVDPFRIAPRSFIEGFVDAEECGGEEEGSH